MINSGAFTHNNGVVTFNGTTTIAGANTLNFNNMNISSVLTGPASDTIGVAGTWANTGTFTHNSGTVEFNGTAAQTITSTGGELLYNVIVNNSTPANALTLNDPVSVQNALTLTDGHIVSTATNILTVGTGGLVVLNATPQDSSFVKGPMRHTVDVSTLVTRIYPIGKGNIYRRVDAIIDQSVTTSTIYSGEVFNSSAVALGFILPPTINRVSAIRNYEVTQDVATALDSVKLRIYYGADDGVADAPNLALAKDDGAGNWIDLGGTASGSPTGDILSGKFTTFSRFALANKTAGLNPLPIDLLSFTAEVIEKEVEVRWATLSESNNDFFTLERSADGIDFEFLTYVEGAGTTNSRRDYKYIDENPLYSTSYYRLKQTDFDGISETFPMVAVSYDPEAGVSIVVYPNPTQGKFWVDVNGPKGDEVIVVVLDMMGREHYSKVVILEDYGYTLAVDPSNKLAPGVYMVVGSSNNKLYSKKLVIR